MRLRRVRGRTTYCFTILLSGALVTAVHLPAFGALAPQSAESVTTQQGAQSSPSQNPTPPGTAPQRPTQPVPPSSQYPPPSAQEPEPPIKDPMIRPAPRPEVAPPSLSIPRLESAPSLDDFLTMQPQSKVALQMAKVTGFSQRNPHDGDPVSQPVPHRLLRY